MKPRLRRFFQGLDIVLRRVATAALIGMFALVVVQVVTRYVFGTPPFFTEEVARYFMIWMTLLATACAVHDRSHINIEFLPQVLAAYSPRMHAALNLLLDVMAAFLFVLILIFGADLVIFSLGQRSEGVRIPMALPHLVIPIAFAAAFAFAISRALCLKDPE